jgi:GNAT superfamily N-acetyltransferase
MKIIEVNRDDIKQLIDQTSNLYSAPADDMWHGSIIPANKHYLINDKGYVIVGDKCMYDFYYPGDNEVFEKVISKLEIATAIAPSYYEPYYELCSSYGESTKIDSLLFKESEHCVSDQELSYELAKPEDIDFLLKFSKDQLDDEGDWLRPYLLKLIMNNGLYIFKDQDIVGLGEIREYQGVANIGMNVSKFHRRKGIGTSIICKLKEISNERGLKTVASTTLENTGSIKTLEKCGYSNYHRITEFSFKER